MSDSTAQAANRRNSHRRSPKDGLNLACHRGTEARGSNLALTLLDASQTGLRLLVREPLRKGDAVLLVMQGPDAGSPVTRAGAVMWMVPMADGSYCVGIQFSRRLLYKDLLMLTQIG